MEQIPSTINPAPEMIPVQPEVLAATAETTALEGLKGIIKPFGAELAQEVVGVVGANLTSNITTTTLPNDNDNHED